MTVLNELSVNAVNELKARIVDYAESVALDDVIADDVHDAIFNEDYFIIGHYRANEWLCNNVSGGVFAAIDIVKNYELDNFGEFNTEINAEAVCNMIVYIAGEELLSECDYLDLDNDEMKAALIEAFKEWEHSKSSLSTIS